MSRLGAAILGCGSISATHARCLKQSEQAELKVVVDNVPEKAQKTAQLNSCDWESDYKKVLERDDIQVVHLCTPHYLHSPMAIDALRAGKHVLTEKPMAESMEGACALVEEAAKHPDLQLGVVFQNRYNHASRKIKEYVDSGELGEMLAMKGLVTWNRNENYYKSDWKGRWATEGGGVLINQAIHTLDLIQWYGGEIAGIKGSITTDALTDVIEVEDTAHALIRFASGVRAIFYATNAYKRNSPIELEIMFEKGTLFTNGHDKVYLRQDGVEELQVCESGKGLTGEKDYWGGSHGLLIEDFYRTIASGNRFWIDGEEGIKALKVVKDIYKSSSQKNGEVPFRIGSM